MVVEIDTGCFASTAIPSKDESHNAPAKEHRRWRANDFARNGGQPSSLEPHSNVGWLNAQQRRVLAYVGALGIRGIRPISEAGQFRQTGSFSFSAGAGTALAISRSQRERGFFFAGSEREPKRASSNSTSSLEPTSIIFRMAISCPSWTGGGGHGFMQLGFRNVSDLFHRFINQGAVCPRISGLSRSRVSLLSGSDDNLDALDRIGGGQASLEPIHMGKLGWTVILVLGTTIGADQYFNSGFYTDATITVLQQIRHGFGW